MRNASKQFLDNCAVSPMYFRKNLIVEGVRFGDVMSKLQQQDFSAIDYPLALLAGRCEKTAKPITKHWRQRSRGFSKTTDAAIDALWLFAFTARPLEGIVAAEDKEQASLVRDSLKILLHENSWLEDLVKLQRNNLVNKSNGATLKFISTDTASSYGERPDFLLCDEFTHWTDEEFWHSLESSYAKKDHKGAILFINCNAGQGRGWQWETKQHAIESPLWYHSAPHGWSPWYTEEMIAEQKALLPPAAFARLFLNKWQADSGGFVSLSEADLCINTNLSYVHSADSNITYYMAGVDYAEKKDRTVGTVGHVLDGKVIIDRMDVVSKDANNGQMVPTSWVSEWMDMVYDKFGTGEGPAGDRQVYFILDPYQLKTVIETQRALGRFVQEFDFMSGVGNFRLSNNLLKAILHRKVVWYPGCGDMFDHQGLPFRGHGNEERDDLSTELSELIIKDLPSGKWKIEHLRGKHDDRAFCLGLLVDFYAQALQHNT